MKRFSRGQLVFTILIFVFASPIVVWRQMLTHGPFEVVVVNDGEPLTAIAVNTIKTVPHLHSVRSVYSATAIVDAGQSAVLPRGYMGSHGVDGPPNLLLKVAHPLLLVSERGMTPVKTEAWRLLSLGVLEAKRLTPTSVSTDAYWVVLSQAQIRSGGERSEPTAEHSARYLVRHFRNVGSVYRRAQGLEALEELRPNLDIEVADLIDQFELPSEMSRYVMSEYYAIFGAQDGN